MGNAPEGKVWVCTKCGKTSLNRYRGPNLWDESCTLNADLVDESRLVYAAEGRVVEVLPEPEGSEE